MGLPEVLEEVWAVRTVKVPAHVKVWVWMDQEWDQVLEATSAEARASAIPALVLEGVHVETLIQEVIIRVGTTWWVALREVVRRLAPSAVAVVVAQ